MAGTLGLYPAAAPLTGKPECTVLGSDADLVQIGDMNLTLTLSLTLTLTLTLPDLNLSIFPSIPCLVSGRRSEPIIIQPE